MTAPRTNAPALPRARAAFAVLFGLVLGLALWKFGNPVILDSKLPPPVSLAEAWAQPWPPHWSGWFLLPVTLLGLRFGVASRFRGPGPRWLWLLPLIWFGWQVVATSQTVDAALSGLTLAHFSGCLACYFLALWGITDDKALRLLLIGLLAAFALCLVRACHQKFFEFPQDKQMLLEGERTGWTNFAPEVMAQMKIDGVIITTNGMDQVSPIIMQKYEKARAYGTLIYPNGLAGAVLLLLPVTLALAVGGTRAFRPVTRWAAIGLAVFLGCGSLLWSASKSGWLIALAMVGVALVWRNRGDGAGGTAKNAKNAEKPGFILRVLRLFAAESTSVPGQGSRRLWRWAALLLVMGLGLAAFGVRFHRYFASGATSVGARFDYWHAAVRNTRDHPVLGSGPGTFQRPYARLKRPESEMARLAHNDYLEQFSDSGVPGGLAYLVWIGWLLAALGRRTWRDPQPVRFAVFLGLLGWFIQGFSEFGLYIPALAWTAFALAGSLLGSTRD